MGTEKTKVLLLDCDEAVLKESRRLLEDLGFVVITASDAKTALACVAKQNPTVIILDTKLENPSSFEIVKKLKNDIVTYHIPILLSTTLEDDDFVGKALLAGADDFLLKPFNPLVLQARVEMVIERLVRERFCNPLTGLAGNVYIENKIEQKIIAGENFAVCYADINHFRYYNLKYGYVKGDEVIRTTGKVINMMLRRFPSHECFLGHRGADNFVFITPIEIAENVCSRIIDTFDEIIPSLYDSDDSRRRSFQYTSRKGQAIKIPLMTLSIGVVTNQNRIIEHPAVINDIAMELKNYAKTFGDSIFVIDRRTARETESDLNDLKSDTTDLSG